MSEEDDQVDISAEDAKYAEREHSVESVETYAHNDKLQYEEFTSAILQPPPSSPQFESKYHYQTKALSVIEEFYGTYVDPHGYHHHIKKFTWKNYNKITVSVINYGARITVMKAPDRRGQMTDVLLGFDGINGHVRNKKYPLGSCLGRCAHFIKEASFNIDRNKIQLTKNTPQHHFNGGNIGFDKVVWTPYVDKSKVIMSYISGHKEEGYPGQLLAKITFELCNKNQFNINYEAHCTEPTIVNMTHLCYFNLAGCSQGPEEILNHILTINSNCYTVQDEDRIPTGEIRNVVNSKYDFQIPKCLNKVIGLRPGDGYHQNYCVNCGVEKGESFIGRLFHPPSGRMIEIYSSQKGVLFSTGNEFGTGAPVLVQDLLNADHSCSTTSLIVGTIYCNLKDILEVDNRNEYFEMRQLIDLVKGVKIGDHENLDKIELTKIQQKYLREIANYCQSNASETKKCQDILAAVQAILEQAKIKVSDESVEIVEISDRQRLMSAVTSHLKNMLIFDATAKYVPQKVKGKDDYTYNLHSGVTLTPANYPNAVNTPHFPNAILRPGEVYKHSTSYRFWVRTGNPNNWIKRKLHEATYEARRTAKKLDEAKAAQLMAEGIKKKNS